MTASKQPFTAGVKDSQHPSSNIICLPNCKQPCVIVKRVFIKQHHPMSEKPP